MLQRLGVSSVCVCWPAVAGIMTGSRRSRFVRQVEHQGCWGCSSPIPTIGDEVLRQFMAVSDQPLSKTGWACNSASAVLSTLCHAQTAVMNVQPGLQGWRAKECDSPAPPVSPAARGTPQSDPRAPRATRPCALRLTWQQHAWAQAPLVGEGRGTQGV